MAHCRRCDHEWTERLKQGKEARSKRCPNCTSPAWDRDLKPRGGLRHGRKQAREKAEPFVPSNPIETVTILPHLPDPIDQAREILRRINA